MSLWSVAADFHLKLYTDNTYTDDGLPLKLDEIFNVFTDVCDYSVANNIENVALLGDINDTKQVASVDAFAIFKQILERYKILKFYIIPGNHDETSSDRKRSAIDLLIGPSNVITVNEPTVIENITFVPYRNLNVLKELQPTDILMSHFGLDEATLSNGKSIRSKIKLKDLVGWKKVFCGHYHKPQELENYYSVGSLLPLTKAEFDETKRFLVLDNETFEVQSIPTKGYRKYFEFVLNDEDSVQGILEEAKKLKEEGNFVSVKNKLKTINNDTDIQVIDEYVPEYQSRGITQAMSLTEQMKRYLEIKNIEGHEADEYLEIGLQLLTI